MPVGFGEAEAAGDGFAAAPGGPGGEPAGGAGEVAGEPLVPGLGALAFAGGDCPGAGEFAEAAGAVAGFSSSVGAALPMFATSGPIRSCPRTTGRSNI